MKRLVLALLLACGSALSAEVYLAQGIMAGEVTDRSALLQTRVTAIPGPELDADERIPGARGVVVFEWSESAKFASSRKSKALPSKGEWDYIVRTEATGLKPHTVHHYRVLLGTTEKNLKVAATGSFRTLAGADQAAEVSFTVGSCMNYNKFLYGKEGKAGPVITATEEDKRLGFPAFQALAELEPDFFIGTGDIVYYDNILNGPAESLEELRSCWHEQFRFPRMVEFFRTVPSYWSKDDHDFRFNDSDNEGDRLPLPQTGIDLFFEQMPIAPQGAEEPSMYRTHRVSRDLQIWLTEGRDHRSPNDAEDGPDKTLWGAEQLAWLKQTLKESDATWKILISPTPMVGPDDAKKTDNHTNLGGFRYEAEAFFDWLQEEEITGFMTVCGDRHWQYHSIHPSGVHEFACGALNDENARVGVKPGSKKGTDPEALIRQPYTYDSPTGGFLHVRSTPDGFLTLTFHDDQGAMLYSSTRRP